MSTKIKSRDQKRKAKLAEQDKRSRELEVFTPYSGRKYQADAWSPVLFRTEQAIHDVIVESNGELINSHVRRAMELLIDHLRQGGPPGTSDDEELVAFGLGRAAEAVFCRVRQAWRGLEDEGQGVATSDLIGIARTLLYSIEARTAHTGESRGYVAFLEEFIPQVAATVNSPRLSLPKLFEPDAIRSVDGPQVVATLAGDVLVLS